MTNRPLSEVVAIVVATTVTVAVFLTAAFFEAYQLRNLLISLSVVGLTSSLIAVIIGLYLDRKTLSDEWWELSHSTRRGALVALAVVILVYLLVPPTTNRIYYDEQIYQNIAQSIAHTGKAFVCNECFVESGEYQVWGKEYNKQPQGHPFFVSLFFRLLGVSEFSAHVATGVCYLLGVIGVFWFTRWFFEVEREAIIAALVFGLTPTVLIWSKTTSSEPYAAGSIALALAATALFAKRATFGSAIVASGLLGLAVAGRPESILVVVPAFAVLLAKRPRVLLESKGLWLGALFCLFAASELLHLVAVQNESWGARGAEERFSLGIFWKNIRVNGGYHLFNEEFPLVFTLLAILGAMFALGWRRAAPLLIWFGYSFGIFLFFYAGSYRYGADIRFSLLSAAPLAISAGMGFGWLVARFREPFRQSASAILLLLLALHWVSFLPLIRAVSDQAGDCRFDVQFAREFAEILPPESIVLSHDPNMWLVWGQNAAQLSIGMEHRVHLERDLHARYRGGVFFHHGYWCNVPDPTQSVYCRTVRERYRMTPLAERTARGKPFGVYKLDLTPPFLDENRS